VVSGLDRSAL
jgi:hypothetical protein